MSDPQTRKSQHSSLPAAVYLIGAGPGDPKLVTVRALELLTAADVVLYDYLVNPAIVRNASPSARCVCLGQHGRSRIWSQAEINEEMVRCARNGQTVARLKGGDPNIFGRLLEEIECLEAAGIPFEIVPGVSAASAASGYAGVPLTSRRSASGVAFVTGHESNDQAVDKLDFASLASFPGTLVVYMGVTTAEKWVSQLLEHGKSADTPVALVRRCSLPDQQVIRCRLIDVPDQLVPYSKFPPPVIAIIGDVAAQRVSVHNRVFRPLYGQTVLITRPEGQQAQAAGVFEQLGAYVLQQPVIEIRPLAVAQPLFDAAAALPQYDWIIFCSANGARHFFDAMHGIGRDTRHLAACRVAATGPATAAELVRHGVRADVVPDGFQAEQFAAALAEPVRGQNVMIIRGSRGRSVLPDLLARSAREVRRVVAYLSTDVPQADPHVCEWLRDGKVDWTLVMSSASARSLVRLFGDTVAGTKIASISPVTSTVLRNLGYAPCVEATTHTLDGIVEAICGWQTPG